MYQPSPELKRLEAEKIEAQQQLTWEQHKYQRLCNRALYYKEREHTARTHRLVTRGAAIESVSPLVKVLGKGGADENAKRPHPSGRGLHPLKTRC